MKKENFFKNFSLPVMSEGDKVHFEINGKNEVLADGCVGVLHYDDACVRLNCGSEIVVIKGEGLTLHHLGGEEAMVKGKVKEIRFV